MTIAIRRAVLERHRSLLIDFLAKYLTPLSNDRRFDWLYLENPDGRAQVWIIQDTKTGALLGTSAVFPRRFYADGKETLGFVLGDFCIHPSLRSLGPAIQLQKACIDEMDSWTRNVGYDFPSEEMLAVHQRLGVRSGDRLIRLAKPLKIKSKCRYFLKALVHLGIVLQRGQARRRRLSGTEQISLHSGLCGEEFSALAVRASGDFGVCLARTADYLNWRYLAHPFQTFEILTARRGGALTGYLALVQEGDNAFIMDLFGMENPELLSTLVAHGVELLRGRGAGTVIAEVLASHRWVHLFERLGFLKCRSAPVITYPCMGGHPGPQGGQKVSWFLMAADRDS